MNRRDALFTGLAAAFGMPLAQKKETNMVALPTPTPRKAPEPTGEPKPLIPCHPANSALCERLVILTHTLREDSRRLLEEHDEDCDCSGCHAADGARWFLEVLESCVESELRAYWLFGIHDGADEVRNSAEVADRLNLPLWMVKEYIRSQQPKCGSEKLRETYELAMKERESLPAELEEAARV
jgi:hypothetical protein